MEVVWFLVLFSIRGVDFEAAGRLGINAQRALSLPGRVAPQAAGEIIKTTIYHMIEEGAE